MALTVKQAGAVNVVLTWLLDPAQPPLTDEVVSAAAALAEGAYERLGAGLTGTEVKLRARVCHR
jgi:hypothetical protein